MTSILAAPVANRPGFWARQFGPNRTGGQDVFDVTFGLVLPVLCFIVDPVVFQSFPLFGPALLEDYQLFAYVVSTVEMGFFLVWRTFPRRVNGFSPLFAGVFVTGACFSLLVGVAMLPLTVLTLLFVIGLVGLIPFFSAFVYLRNGIRAMKAQANHLPLASRITTATLSGMLVAGLLTFASVYVETTISASIDTVIYGNIVEAKAATNRLKWFRFVPLKQRNRLAVAYAREWDPAKQWVLKEAYQEIASDNIELRSRMLSD